MKIWVTVDEAKEQGIWNALAVSREYTDETIQEFEASPEVMLEISPDECAKLGVYLSIADNA